MGVNLSTLAAPGANQPFIQAFTPPLVSPLRGPTTNDKAPIGTLWVNRATNQAWILTSVANNLANWLLIETGGGGGAFSTLTSTGATTLATTGASTNTFGNTFPGTTVELLGGNSAMQLTQDDMVFNSPSFIFSGGPTTFTGGSNLIIDSASSYISLAGSNILVGPGVPDGSLATAIGCIYINQNSATATTRLYIASAIGTWVNVTCSA